MDFAGCYKNRYILDDEKSSEFSTYVCKKLPLNSKDLHTFFVERFDAEGMRKEADRVTEWRDPTAHAEIVAIRDACAKLGSHQLEGCVIYASSEPCPMCLGAIYWARPAAVYFANDRTEAAAAGFDDAFIYDELGRRPAARRMRMQRVDIPGADEPFRRWRALPGREGY